MDEDEIYDFSDEMDENDDSQDMLLNHILYYILYYILVVIFLYRFYCDRFTYPNFQNFQNLI